MSHRRLHDPRDPSGSGYGDGFALAVAASSRHRSLGNTFARHSLQQATVLLLAIIGPALAAADAVPVLPGPAVPGPGAQAPLSAPESQPTAEAALVAANAAIADGRLSEAHELLTRAQLSAPQDSRIRAALADIARLTGDTPVIARSAPAPVLIEWALAEIRQGQVRADAMARAGRLNDAAELLEVVRRNLIARELDSSETVAAALGTVDSTVLRYRRESLEIAARSTAAARDRALAEAREHASEVMSSAASSRAERLARIRGLQRKALFEQALAECRTLIDREPDDEEVRTLFRELLGSAHAQRKLTTDQTLIEARQELSERISRSLIPTGIDGWPVYPADWLARHTSSDQRDRLPGDPDGKQSGDQNSEPEWRSVLRDSLRRRTSLDVDAQNGFDVLRALALDSRINLVIDPALTAGADRNVTLHAPNLTVEHALTWLCQLMDTRWTLVNGAVWVGTPPTETTTLGLYDVANLVHRGFDQPGKKLTLGDNASSGSGTSLFSANEADQVKPPTPEEVVDLLKTSVTPSVWTEADNGITIRGTTLYITAPPETHRILREFIGSQEQAQNLMVRVDARWLVLEDSFAEEIGVDWTIDGTQLAFNQPASGFATENNNSNFIGSAVTPLPPTSNQSRSGVTGQGLKLSFGLIGPIQLSAILTAAENNLRGRVLTSPSVTTINGVRSNVFVGDQTAYISDYSIVSSNLDPTISVLTTGNSLDVKPFVSADRKYVTMDFQPATSSARYFTDYLSGPRVILAGDGSSVGGVSNAVAYPIELPNVAVKEAATTLTIPDRGSVLIGGFGKAADESSSSRVPFLGNIPYLGRLFGHRGRYSDHEKLYLMATITIISYDEQEAKL